MITTDIDIAGKITVTDSQYGDTVAQIYSNFSLSGDVQCSSQLLVLYKW